MLLVWLFALGSGVVNACLVAPALQHAVRSATRGAQGVGQAQAVQPTGAAVGHDHQNPRTDQPPCTKFCDDGSASAPTVKQQDDPLHAVGLAPPPARTAAMRPLQQPVGEPHVERGRLHARVPIPIAFLRLTL